jgi:hypothetical protein
MKKLFIFLCIALAWACQKNMDDFNPNDPNLQAVNNEPCKVTTLLYYKNPSQYTKTITYNDNGFPTKIIDQCSPCNFMLGYHTYYDYQKIDNRVQKITATIYERTRMFYNGGGSYIDTVTHTVVFELDNRALLQRILQSDKKGDPLRLVNDYQYDSNNKLKTCYVYKDNKAINHREYSYDANNILKGWNVFDEQGINIEQATLSFFISELRPLNYVHLDEDYFWNFSMPLGSMFAFAFVEATRKSIMGEYLLKNIMITKNDKTQANQYISFQYTYGDKKIIKEFQTFLQTFIGNEVPSLPGNTNAYVLSPISIYTCQ